MVGLADVVSLVRADWGWLVVGGYIFLQLYNPLWETKLQSFTNDFTQRLQNIEITQVAIAQEVEGVSDERVSSLHDRDHIDPSDLKDNGSDRPIPDSGTRSD